MNWPRLPWKDSTMTNEPKRVRLSRAKGWRKPENCVVVARPSRWGNSYKVERNRVPLGNSCTARRGPMWSVVEYDKWGRATGGEFGGFDTKADAAVFAVELFRRALLGMIHDVDGGLRADYYFAGLRGKDLACWCPLDEPCHADVLLALANATDSGVEGQQTP